MFCQVKYCRKRQVQFMSIEYSCKLSSSFEKISIIYWKKLDTSDTWGVIIICLVQLYRIGEKRGGSQSRQRPRSQSRNMTDAYIQLRPTSIVTGKNNCENANDQPKYLFLAVVAAFSHLRLQTRFIHLAVIRHSTSHFVTFNKFLPCDGVLAQQVLVTCNMIIIDKSL